MAMMALDRTISFDGKMPNIIILPTTPKPLPPDVPPVQPKPISGWAAFFAAIFSLFKRK
jgi:hypothetical protein